MTQSDRKRNQAALSIAATCSFIIMVALAIEDPRSIWLSICLAIVGGLWYFDHEHGHCTVNYGTAGSIAIISWALMIVAATCGAMFVASLFRLQIEALSFFGGFLCLFVSIIINDGGERKADTRIWEETIWVMATGLGLALILNAFWFLTWPVYLAFVSGAALYRANHYWHKP